MTFNTVACGSTGSTGCGTPMIRAKNPESGKINPMDARGVKAVVVEVPGQGDVTIPVNQAWLLEADEVGRPVMKRPGTLYVSHFKTCPDAAHFSRTKTGAADGIAE